VHYDVAIVGAGHGGAQAAIALRQHKFAGTVALIGDEPDLPYERPPLSKEYFAGEKPFERIQIRPAAFWGERAIDLKLGSRVATVDAAAHRLSTQDGHVISYGQMVWATGGSPRSLTVPGGNLPGVFVLRTRAGADALRHAAKDAAHIVVIGGGYIGLESAAVLVKSGKQVTLIEAAPRVLARVAGEPLSRWFEAKHRAHGVDVQLNVAVDAIEGGARVAGVRLAGGDIIAADLVLVGIGIVPAVEPLLIAGAADGGPSGGVLVDDGCRTSLPDVFAIGDCAAHRSRYAEDAVIRIESVQNAHDMAAVVARTLCGDARTYDAVPWFWSNQYDVKLQTVGLSAGHDDVVVRGDPDTGSFSLIYLKSGRVIALDCVNAVRDYAQGRALITGGHSVAASSLANIEIPLKALVAG
jgi:3-phenylpropionate/trans-cinnamate dioxygenase ferredoxin reductase subunit